MNNDTKLNNLGDKMKNKDLSFVVGQDKKTTKIRAMVNHPERPWEMVEQVIEVDTAEFNKLENVELPEPEPAEELDNIHTLNPEETEFVWEDEDGKTHCEPLSEFLAREGL